MRAAIYCRISQDREGAGLGVERQRADCEALAKERGWSVVGTYVDNDISAYSGRKRPEYRRLLKDMQAGQVDTIIAWHTDRLHRSPRELEEFIDICDVHKVRVETVRAGELDLKTPAGRAVARTLGAWARYESEHRSERLRRKRVERAQRGLPNGGSRCYGFTKDHMEVIPEEAAVLREIADRVLAGDTLRSIAIDLNRRGLVTTTGLQWYSSAVRRLMLSPSIAGLIEHHTAGRVRARWPAVISPEKRTRLVSLLTDPARRTNPGAPRRHLLSGILRCGECGKLLTGHGKASTMPRRRVQYTCVTDANRGCGRVAIEAGVVEPYVVDALLSTLEKLRVSTSRAPDADDAADIDALSADRTQLEELASLYASRTISVQEWIRARSDIEARISERNRRIADRTSDHRLREFLRGAVALRDAWPALSVERQRALLAAAFDRITVNRATKGRVFDPSRLVPVWRV